MTALRKTLTAPTSDAAPFVIRAERASDVVAREAMLDACFGDNRHTRTCQRLRDGALDSAWGMIAPTGASASPTKARRAKLVRPVPQAA